MSELEDCKLVTRGPDWIWISPRSFFNSEMALHLSGCFSVTPRNKAHPMSNKSVTQWLVLTAGLDSQKKKKRGSPKAFIDLYYVCASKEFIPCLYHQVINPNGKVSLIYKIFASREYGARKHPAKIWSLSFSVEILFTRSSATGLTLVNLCLQNKSTKKLSVHSLLHLLYIETNTKGNCIIFYLLYFRFWDYKSGRLRDMVNMNSEQLYQYSNYDIHKMT